MQVHSNPERRTSFFFRPQGVPRGFLIYYLLHRISKGPVYGYELLQGIEKCTDGAWAPGPGSIYPLLRRLKQGGLVRARAERRGRIRHWVYSLTPRGEAKLKAAMEEFPLMARKANSVRRLWMEMIPASELPNAFLMSARTQFALAKELFDFKSGELDAAVALRTLKQYAIELEAQMDWVTKKTLEEGRLKEV